MALNSARFQYESPRPHRSRAEGAVVGLQGKARRILMVQVRFEPVRVEEKCWSDAYESIEPIHRRVLPSTASEEAQQDFEPRRIGGGVCGDK
jgi:hypothetical protein